MTSVAVYPTFRAFTAGSATSDVRPLALGWVYTYDAGTLTPKATFQDDAGLVPNPNPTPLDARGEANIRLGVGSYKFITKDSLFVQQGPVVDNIKSIEQITGAYTDLFRADLANTTDATKGDALIAVKQDTYASAPALTLHKWIERGVVDAKRQALPSNFVFATDDAAPYLQNIIADAQTLQQRVKIAMNGSDTWRIGSRLTLDSDRGTGLIGVGGQPILLWTGATLNPATQDDENGAMVYFSGLDHEWGGLENVILDGQSKAVHGAYMNGLVNGGFQLSRLHMQYFQLDCISVVASGTISPIEMIIDRFSAFPANVTYGGVLGVCGRFPINLRLNDSVGIIAIRDCNSDNGAAGFVGLTAQTAAGFAGTDLMIDNYRFEQNMAAGDLVVVNYAAGSSQPGTVTMRGCKHAVSLGSTASVVRNKSTSALRPDIHFTPFLSNDSVTNIYKDDFDAGKTVPYMLVEHRGQNFSVMHSANSTPGAYPPIARAVSAGRVSSPVASPATVVVSDFDRRFTNYGLAGAITFNLPAVASAGLGFRVHFSATQAAVITLDPSGAELVDGLATLASNGSANASITVEVSPSGRWTSTAKTGTWA